MVFPLKYKAVVVVSKGKFELQEKTITHLEPNQVLVKVLAEGVCRGDEVCVEFGHHPRVPGHEVIGVVEEVGANVHLWKKGQRVGAGWFGGRCGDCPSCRKGDFATCVKHFTTGLTHDGGYAEYLVQPQEALALIPSQLSNEQAAPIVCAGVTVFGALRNSGAKPGDIVAIQGLGGLGHIAIQYSLKMGFKTVVLGRGTSKKEEALRLGAHLFIDWEERKTDPGVQTLKEWGGANVILSTSPPKALAGTPDILAVNGTIVTVSGSHEHIPLSPLELLVKRGKVMTCISGSSIDWEDALKFTVLTGVSTQIKTYPLEKAEEAYREMLKGDNFGRIVLVPSQK
eukprot:TRINITY_DN5109_c0_g1_i2.p1 TRINITY_DN5109_c0_g1~~TRINITY_DN5109_c0_g1_i2.p1  ORF type:complete len:341 (+),score=84.40 TRINITY_DN5109_c0_g1_i2:197-1219(+)